MSVISVNPIYPDLENQFPASVDIIKKFVDPALEDLQTINRYYNYIDSGNLIAADAILSANPRLQQMCLNADSLNPLIDAIISMQRYYINDIQRYLVNIVKAKGNWNASSRYTKYDVVQYVNKSAIESYMGIVEVIPIGTLPTSLDYFTPLTLRGEQGASGTGLSPRGDWSGITTYYKDDCIVYNNMMWYAKVGNSGKAPQDISEYWGVLLRVPQQVISSPTQPQGQATGDFWFKTFESGNVIEIYKKNPDGTYGLALPNANNALTANVASNVAWDNVSGKPTDWAPSAHNHDSRYYTEAETNNLLNSKEPAFSKNNAFNKNFGTAAGTVCQGNDSRLFDARPANGGTASAVPWGGITGKPGSFTPVAHTHDDRYYTEAEANSLLSGKFSINGGIVSGNVTVNGTLTATNVVGANWNDYAEYRQSLHDLLPGTVAIEDIVNDDCITICNERLNPTAMIVSDTFGFCIGQQNIKNKYSLPIAISGRVLAYTDVDRLIFKVGDCVCAGANGTVSRMTCKEIKDYPHCILGIVSSIPRYNKWGTGNVNVNNRIWIRIK